jgi:CheY-like chemotaxis protein
VKESYVVACHGCRGSFDAMDTSWCSCISAERTLVCPRCLACFCKAPATYKSGFWSQAPKSLWDRKFEEHNAYQVEVPENPAPENVVRPLVLIVEDEKPIRKVAARVVESLGYGIVLATNGEEGLELARRYKPDLVLSDALMPRMDGREMCRRLKDDPETAGIKVIVMTSLYKSVKYRNEAKKSFRVDGYVDKPLDFQQLQTILQQQLEQPVLAASAK